MDVKQDDTEAARTSPGGLLERVFRLSEHGTTIRTEILAGVTTFLTMAYIVFLNPTILALANGIAFGFVTYAVLKLLCGRAREVRPAVWIIAALFLFKFVEQNAAH